MVRPLAHTLPPLTRQFNPMFYDEDDPMNLLPPAMRQRLAGQRQVFDEHYRCYPVAMLSGPDRESANHGSKVLYGAQRAGTA